MPSDPVRRLHCRALPAAPAASANERFKRTAAAWTWCGLIAATVIHFVTFAAWPTLTAEAMGGAGAPPVHVIPPPHPPLPEVPPPPARPPAPVAGDVPDDLVPPPDMAYLLQDPPPAPPPPPEQGAGSARAFVPYTIAPVLTNEGEMARLLEREYPPHLRDAGVGGTVVLQVLLSEEGRLLEVRVATSSGMEAIDRAALRVAPRLRFTPALNRDRPVAVWITLPVTFEARETRQA